MIDDRRGAGQTATVRTVGAGIVEDDVAADRDEAVPRVPVELAAGLGVVAVDEHEVDLLLPARGELGGEAGMPVHGDSTRATTAQSAGDGASGRPLGGAPAGGQRVGMATEGIDQVQLRTGGQPLTQDDRGGPLVHPDLDHATRPASRVQQHGGVLGGVHGARWDQPGTDRERAQTHVVAQAFGSETTQAGG